MNNGYIDVHVHPIRRLIDPKQLIVEMNSCGVERAILLALDIDKDILYEKKEEKKFKQKLADSMVWDIESEYQLALNILDIGRTENSYVSKLVKMFPNRFIGFGSINPRKGKKYIKMKIEEISDLGLIGLKLIPTLQFFDPSKNRNLNYLWKLANDIDLIILYHTGCDPGPWEKLGLCKNGHPGKIERLISQYDLQIILAHAGSYSAEKPGIWLKDALRLANKYENVWLDTAAVPNIFHEEWIVDLLRDYGLLSKILFGSDFPVIQGLDMAQSISLIELSPHLSKSEKISILRSNALKLLSNRI